MRLSVVIPILNRPEITIECLKNLKIASKTNPEIVLIDNGSTPKFAQDLVDRGETLESLNIAGIVQNDENLGVWETFRQGMSHTTGDILAFIHNDLYIYDENWDGKLIEAFESDSRLGMVGFVGSTEWDRDGGRGLGTASNFQGRGGVGSPAEHHGRRIFGLEPALQVDGCSMVLRREAIDQTLIAVGNWPPHHFYDRIVSLELIKAEWHVGTYGIACDHVSGQTANTQADWHSTAQKWAEANGVAYDQNWDHTVYKEAERRFLSRLHEYMGDISTKLRVNPDHTIAKL